MTGEGENSILRLIPVPNARASVGTFKTLARFLVDSCVALPNDIRLRVTKAMPRGVAPISYGLGGISSLDSLFAILDKFREGDTAAIVFHPGASAQTLFSIGNAKVSEVALDGYADISPFGIFQLSFVVVFSGKVNEKEYPMRLGKSKGYKGFAKSLARAACAKRLEAWIEG